MAEGAGVKKFPIRKDSNGNGRAAGAAKHAERGPAKVRERLDVALVTRGLAESGEKAARLILAGAVIVDGQLVDKAGALVHAGAVMQVTAGPKFVSRGGDKLAPVLDAFAVSPTGRVCLDVGASTGGFTHCLLER